MRWPCHGPSYQYHGTATGVLWHCRLPWSSHGGIMKARGSATARATGRAMARYNGERFRAAATVLPLYFLHQPTCIAVAWTIAQQYCHDVCCSGFPMAAPWGLPSHPVEPPTAPPWVIYMAMPSQYSWHVNTVSAVKPHDNAMNTHGIAMALP